MVGIAQRVASRSSSDDAFERSTEVANPTDSMVVPEVLIVTTLGGGGIQQYVEQLVPRLGDTIDVRVYDMYSNPKGSGVLWAVSSILRSALALIRFPFRSAPDVAHVHTSHAFSFLRAAVYVFTIATLWRCPIILHIHGSSFDDFIATESRLLARLQHAVFDRCDHVVVLSRYWEAVLEPAVGADKVEVIPNAVDVDAYSPQYDPPVPRIAFVSNLIDRKGVREFVEGIDHLYATLSSPFEVRIAGDGPLRTIVEDLVAEHDDVEYLGYVSEEEKREILESASIFVLPTYAEGLPFAVLEGMAGGNAVVSTRVGAIPELIGDDGGVLVDPGDTDALIRGMRQLITAPTRTNEMGRRNRATARARFDWSTVAEDVLDLYRSAAGTEKRDSDRRTREIRPPIEAQDD